MSADLGLKFQDMFKTIYESADRKYVRPFKRQMFQCGYKCMDDKNSISQCDDCIEDCGKGLKQVMGVLQTEINAFQGRIDRCLMNCQDDVRHYKDETDARRVFDGCAEKCIVQFTPAVADVTKVITDKLGALKKEHNVK